MTPTLISSAIEVEKTPSRYNLSNPLIFVILTGPQYTHVRTGPAIMPLIFQMRQKVHAVASSTSLSFLKGA